MKITRAKGEGQSQCRRCKEKGIFNVCWCSFMYEIEGHEGHYCSKCTEEIIEKECDDKVKHYYRMTRYLGSKVQGVIIKCYTEKEMLLTAKAWGNEYELIKGE